MPLRTSFSVATPVMSGAVEPHGCPELTRMIPTSAFRRVDLPAPLGPTIAVIRPARVRRLTSEMTGAPP